MDNQEFQFQLPASGLGKIDKTKDKIIIPLFRYGIWAIEVDIGNGQYHGHNLNITT